jgi:excisionase family DNA binding protein
MALILPLTELSRLRYSLGNIMPDITVAEAARRLRLHPTRVRALLRAGELIGQKLGAHWLVDEASARRRLGSARAEGRPFSAKRAWGFLLLLSGEDAPWLDRASRSRLRARARRSHIRALLPRLRRRASVHHFRASADAIARIQASPALVPSGASAAAHYGASIVARQQIDGYVAEPQLRELSYRLVLEPIEPELANVVLRVSAFPLALKGRSVAPIGVVAVDLAESADQRGQRAGVQLAEELRDRVTTGR